MKTVCRNTYPVSIHLQFYYYDRYYFQKIEPQGALIAHLSTMSTSVIS